MLSAIPAQGQVRGNLKPSGLTGFRTVTVGNTRNQADADTGFGAVAYEYAIMRDMVTLA